MPILGSRGAGAASAFGFTSGGLALDVDYLLVAGGGGVDKLPEEEAEAEAFELHSQEEQK